LYNFCHILLTKAKHKATPDPLLEFFQEKEEGDLNTEMQIHTRKKAKQQWRP
jgi:hypothetical protein